MNIGEILIWEATNGLLLIPVEEKYWSRRRSYRYKGVDKRSAMLRRSLIT